MGGGDGGRGGSGGGGGDGVGWWGWGGGKGRGKGDGKEVVAREVCVFACVAFFKVFVICVCVFGCCSWFWFSFWLLFLDIVRCRLLLVITIVPCSRVVISSLSCVVICP